MSWGRFDFRRGAPAWSFGLRPLGRPSTQKPAPCAVVVIDDDDDDFDGGGSDSEVFMVNAGKTFPTTSRCRAKKGDGPSGNVINLDDDDDEVVEEVSRGDQAGPSTARSAGCPAAATPERASSRNRYGLDCASDSSENGLSEGWYSESGSESDESTSDCEIMDDTSGTARKMWETAASSRKRVPNRVHSGKEGMAAASTSSSGSETQPGEAADPHNCASSERDVPKEYGDVRFSDAWKGEQSSTCDAEDDHGPSILTNGKGCLYGNASDGKETECVRGSNGDVKDSHAESHVNEEVFQHFSHADKAGEQNSTGAAKDCSNLSSGQNTDGCSDRNVSNGKRPDCCANPTLDADTAQNGKTSHFNNGAVPNKASDGIQSTHLDQTFVDSFVSAKRVFPASSSPYWKYGTPPFSVSTPEKMDESIPEGVCSPSHKDQSPSDAENVASGSCSLSRKDPIDDPEGFGQFTLVQEASDFQDDLIGEREKHKETAEFRRAAEEEWASRQQQIQIQAQEAKKLRKRKKAEALRLLDMEKKQKQRLEEVRESQKKNEEEMQLKEQYRCVVRNELEDTKRRYSDTPSILRVLGIPVEGDEVRAALKQAQVKFHPDRVSRNDIYQQVKAEETFKFISRLKEKLPRYL